jgi:hypothetical protein
LGELVGTGVFFGLLGGLLIGFLAVPISLACERLLGKKNVNFLATVGAGLVPAVLLAPFAYLAIFPVFDPPISGPEAQGFLVVFSAVFAVVLIGAPLGFWLARFALLHRRNDSNTPNSR